MSPDDTRTGERRRPFPRSRSDEPTFAAIRSVDEFRKAGETLFGSHGWIRETSRRMGVAETTIWRWIGEQTPMAPYALAAMSAWLRVFEATGERPPRLDASRERSTSSGDDVVR